MPPKTHSATIPPHDLPQPYLPMAFHGNASLTNNHGIISRFHNYTLYANIMQSLILFFSLALPGCPCLNSILTNFSRSVPLESALLQLGKNHLFSASLRHFSQSHTNFLPKSIHLHNLQNNLRFLLHFPGKYCIFMSVIYSNAQTGIRSCFFFLPQLPTYATHHRNVSAILLFRNRSDSTGTVTPFPQQEGTPGHAPLYRSITQISGRKRNPS